jgi:hypothetical protein
MKESVDRLDMVHLERHAAIKAIDSIGVQSVSFAVVSSTADAAIGSKGCSVESHG